MTNLIDRTDFASNNRKISQSGFNSGTLDQHISDAQFVDVQKLMGLDFFNDMIRNYTDPNYQALLNEGSYTYNSTTYTNVGLKSVIVFYAYARYVLMGSQTDTPFGYVEKTTTDSARVSDGGKKNMYKENQNIAFNYWENVRNFLDRNSSDYPLWKSNCFVKRGTFRVSKIG